MKSGRWIALWIAASAPAMAQDSAPEPAFDLGAQPIDPARLLVTDAGEGARGKKPCVPSSRDGEIVVCAEDERKYIGAETVSTRDTTPRAPDVGAPAGGIGIRIGSVPEPAYFIDFDSLPDPLPEDDADKVLFAEDTPDTPDRGD